MPFDIKTMIKTHGEPAVLSLFILAAIACWLGMMHMVSQCKESLAVGEALVNDCDYIYLESESPRYHLYEYLRKDDCRNINHIVALYTVLFAVYLASLFLLFASAVSVLIVPEHMMNVAMFLRIFIMVGAIIALIVIALRAQDGDNSFKPYGSSTDDKKDKTEANKTVATYGSDLMYIFIFVGATSFAGYIAIEKDSGMNAYLRTSIVLFTIVAALWAIAHFYVPKLVAAFQGYRSITNVEIRNLITGHQDLYIALESKEYRRNAMAKDNAIGRCTKDTIYQYFEHRKGQEFKQIENEPGVQPKTLDDLRKYMQALREDEGVDVAKSFYSSASTATIVSALFVSVTLAYYLFSYFKDSPLFEGLMYGLVLLIALAFIAYTLAMWGYAAVVNSGGSI